ncbi:hypothetical protein QFC19_008319 [Naganishia cerealis]|uniref:Uncharacterized protein n=1 Tax=Naganishia cerealis TaxID=610337 RepID=A0ACC2V278_9TREE|nr:hypothetical protein QFC19_008319 [Naganishia cerealis]
MSFTPPRTTKSIGHGPQAAREGSPFGGANKTQITPAKNVAYSPSAHLSPALSNLKKHSLYGTEDRVIIDPGSRIWKVGFSGEARPRKVFWSTKTEGVNDDGDGAMWDLDFDNMLMRLNARRLPSTKEEPKATTAPVDYEEVLQLIKARLTIALRGVYIEHLLTESKSRKVIIVENALLPNPIKQLISEVLFDNLKVPSVSFTPGHMLTLMATGNTTGLVVDFGFHETTVIPVYQSRVLYPYLTTTPTAGKAFLQRLRRLIEAFGSYTAPTQSQRPVRPDARRPAQSREETSETEHGAATEFSPVPAHALDWRTLEDVRSRGCFVGASPLHDCQRPESEEDFQEYAKIHSTGSRTKDATFVIKRSDISYNTNNGVIRVPGWIRERAAESFFEDGDVDAMSVVEVILSCLTSVSNAVLVVTVFWETDSVRSIATDRSAESHDLIDRRFWRGLYDARVHSATSHTAFAKNSAQRRREHGRAACFCIGGIFSPQGETYSISTRTVPTRRRTDEDAAQKAFPLTRSTSRQPDHLERFGSYIRH